MAKSGGKPASIGNSTNKNNLKNSIIKNNHELSLDKLRWHCPVSLFKFKSTEELEPLDEIVGQPRAIEAIRLGAELFSKGYNIFVSGLSGTGRLSTVKKLLEGVTTYCPQTFDYCYVNNFEDNDRPRLIKLPAGKGKEFSVSMNDAIAFLKRRISKLFEEENFQVSRRRIIEDFQQKEKEILDRFDERIKPFGFIRGQIENEQGAFQPEVFPVIDNKPVQIENLQEFIQSGTITKEKSEELINNYRKFHNEIFDLARVGIKMMQDFRKALYDNDKSAASIVIDSIFNEITERYNNEKVTLYILEVKKFILENLNIFVPGTNPLTQPTDEESEQKETDNFQIFTVNVVLDNSNTDCAPVVVETSPTYTNLFGTIERSYDNRGFWRTDFTKIKAGALLRADQGYLIVNALDVFTEPGVWPALKRVLLYDKLEIQPYEAIFQLSQLHLKPEPVDVKVKVIIIGGQSLYRMLYLYEKGFKKIFKVNAQFDYEMERSEEMMQYYARFISKICREDNLPHCHPDGVAAIIEWAIELAGSQDRISLKFSDVADILRESAFYMRGKKSKLIDREDVKKAIAWRRHRNDLMDEKLRRYISEGSILIDVEGERIGQINGLTVIDTGLLSFGKPSRITASISVGTSGIIHIEREVELSGAIHSKGVLILTGILRERFAQKKPMNLTASLTFEQTYGGVDGDSATAAEIYTILSELARVPIKQTFAITGSVNQKGDIQPIGGVNEKIYGFYEICKERGFTGTQGVIIPVQNVKDLMLCDEVIDDINKSNFHIYSISKIEEGIEILMGITAGDIQADGTYPKGTLFHKVEERLEELRIAAKEEEEVKKKKKRNTKKNIKNEDEEE